MFTASFVHGSGGRGGSPGGLHGPMQAVACLHISSRRRNLMHAHKARSRELPLNHNGHARVIVDVKHAVLQYNASHSSGSHAC